MKGAAFLKPPDVVDQHDRHGQARQGEALHSGQERYMPVPLADSHQGDGGEYLTAASK